MIGVKKGTFICYGNHDVSYEWDKLESGFSAYAYATVNARLEELYKKHGKDRFQFIHKIDNVLFSHAGLTRGFLHEIMKCDISTPIDEIIRSVNELPGNVLWNDASPIWARPEDGYAYYSRGLLQVVGHTPVEKVRYDEDKHLLMTDTFSTYCNGSPYGNRKFTWVDTDTKKWGST